MGVSCVMLDRSCSIEKELMACPATQQWVFFLASTSCICHEVSTDVQPICILQQYLQQEMDLPGYLVEKQLLK